MEEVDERYKRGMIYTIRNYTDDTMIYVGSTINTLSKRFYNHKIDYKTGRSLSLYLFIDNDDWTDWYIELYEQYPCNNKKELERREGEVIREIGTINKNIAGRTHKEWRENKKNEIDAKKKKYYENNKNMINEKRNKKVCCNICGTLLSKASITRHQKRKICMSKKTAD